MSVNRRDFLGATIGGMAAFGTAGLWGTSELAHAASWPQPDPALGFRPDTLFLTWQRDPTTTMTIQWLGHELPQSPQITYAPLGKDEWQSAAPKLKPFPTTEFKVFRTELTGLSPGTEYQFKIGDKSPAFRFRTMPAKATNDFTFVSGGDAGVNQHVIDNNLIAAKQDPMFCIMGGDIAYDNGVSAPTNIQYHRDYSRTMIDTQGRLIPMVVCIGNHEVGRNRTGPLHERAPYYFAWHDGLFADTSYATLDFGDYLSLVLLDTNHAMHVHGDQTSWLEKTLAERVDIPNLIPVNHVPAYPSVRDFNNGGGASNRKHWVPLFEKYNVDLVLEHHDHAFKRSFPMKDGLKDPNGILYLGDGSWGKIRRPQQPEKAPYLVTASESYHFSVHRLEGEERFHMAINDSGKILDICSTKKKPRGKSMG